MRSLAVGPHVPVGFGLGLDSAHLYYFAYAVKHMRILIFSYKQIRNTLFLELDNNLLNIYLNNNYLNFIVSIFETNILNK
jgi:hypothetical protein